MNAWSHQELRLTKQQVDFLTKAGGGSVHQKYLDRTELILGQRKMMAWQPGRDGEYHLMPNAKGRAAIKQYQAANDNHRRTKLG